MTTSPTTNNPWFAVSMGLVGLIVGYSLASGVMGVTRTPGQPSLAGSAASVAAAPTPVAPTPATADDDAVFGDLDAPITLVEFSDLQCPFCRKFFRETLSQIKEEYVATGKVKLVFRDFPLSFHPAARPSANAMECAQDQSDALAWAVHDALYAEQDKQGVNTIQYTIDDIKKWTANIRGLDQKTYVACLDANTYADEIQADFNAGIASGVDGTPGFWVLGPDDQAQQISGAVPFEQFKAVFDEML